MIIGIINQKGGAGKTTIAVNLAAVLAKRDRRVLVLDTDEQESAIDWAAARQDEPLFQVLGLPRPTIHKEIGGISKGYDHVIVDCPPRSEAIARSAISASDLLIIPAQPGALDVWSTAKAVQQIEESQTIRQDRKACFVINRKIANTVLGRVAPQSLAIYPFPVCKKTLTQRVVFAEAFIYGKAVYEMEDAPAAAEFEDLANELMESYGL